MGLFMSLSHAFCRNFEKILLANFSWFMRVGGLRMQGRLLTKVNLLPDYSVSIFFHHWFCLILVTTNFKAKKSICFALKKERLSWIFRPENKTSASRLVHTFQIQFQNFDMTSHFCYLVNTNALNHFERKSL